jgi:NADPH:quinone reductase-like Zn-dependent oxidoreductase
MIMTFDERGAPKSPFRLLLISTDVDTVMNQPTIIVTGASQGLGAAIASMAASRGANVVLTAPHEWSGEILEWDDERVQSLA